MNLPVWTALLCEVYRATGSMLAALRVVGLRPSAYHALLATNPEFASRVAQARPDAQHAAAGAVLARVFGARHPALPALVAAVTGGGAELSDGRFVRRLATAVEVASR